MSDTAVTPLRYRLWPDLLLILVVGLTPLLWLTPGTIVTGGDANFPLDPIEWFKGRSFVWNDLFNCGIPAAINATSLFFHGLQALGVSLGLSLFTTQQAFYVFWFTAVCLAIYYFMAVVQGDRPNRLERLVAVCFYAYNPLMFNIWEASKAAELSALVAMPTLLAWLILGVEGRIPLWALACRTAILAVVVSEVGAGPPVLGAVLMVPLVFLACRVARAMARGQARTIRRDLGVFLGLSAAFASASAFWLLPYGFEIYDQVLSKAHGGLSAFNLTDWLKGISTHTSFLNVSRLQGAWDWYYLWNKEPYIAYAAGYSRSPLLLLLSAAFPIVAYSAIIVRRGFLTLFFAGLTLGMTILATGAHPPFGVLYLALVERVPILGMFRSPYYKFGLVMAFGYAYLIAVAARGWRDRWQPVVATRRWLARLPGSALGPKYWGAYLIGLNLIYAFPLLTGEIVYQHRTMPSIKLTIPPYVMAAARWFAAQPDEGRILSMPKDSVDIYKWGYASIVHVLHLASRRGILSSRDFVAGFESANTVRESIYNIIYHRWSSELLQRMADTPWAGRLLGLLDCRYILLRFDSWFDFYGNKDSPAQWARALHWQEEIRPVAQLGAWRIYSVATETPRCFAVEKATLVKAGIADLGALAARHDTAYPAWLFANDLMPPQLRDLLETGQLGAVALHQAGWRELVVDLVGRGAITPFPTGQRGVTLKVAGEGLHELWVRLLPSVRPEDAFNNNVVLTVNRNRVIALPATGLIAGGLPEVRGLGVGSWYSLGQFYLPFGDVPLETAIDNRWIQEVAAIPAPKAEQARALLRRVLENPAVDVTMTLSTEQMAAGVRHPDPGDPVTLRSVHNFYRSGPWPEDQRRWQWVRRYWKNLVVKHHPPGATWQTASRYPAAHRNLGLIVKSPGIDRALYLHLTGPDRKIHLVEYPPVWAVSPRHLVFRHLPFGAGRNTLDLHSPHAGARAQEGEEPVGSRAYALGFDDIRLGPARFTTRVDVPRAGLYEVRVFPRPATLAQQQRLQDAARHRDGHAWLSCDGRPVAMAWSEPIATGYQWLVGQVTLRAGLVTVVIDQLDEEDYYVELRSPADAPAPAAAPLAYERLTPTKYAVHWPSSQQGFLVFANAFHPRWYVGVGPEQSTVALRLPVWSVARAWPLIRHGRLDDRWHWQVNGYGNAWHVRVPQRFRDVSKTTPLTIVYAPQALFEVGVVLSCIAVGLGILGCLWWGVQRRRRP